jgi:hypothetical protein
MLPRPNRKPCTAVSARLAKPVHRWRLPTVAEAGIALAGCLRALEQGLMAPAKAKVLIYGYGVLAGVIQGAELERRIRTLEAALWDDDDAST